MTDVIQLTRDAIAAVTEDDWVSFPAADTWKKWRGSTGMRGGGVRVLRLTNSYGHTETGPRF